MKSYVVINKQTGVILNTYISENSLQDNVDNFWNDTNKYVHIEIPSHLDMNVIKCTKSENTFIIEQDDGLHSLKLNRNINLLRSERNKRLASSDWTQLRDVQITPEQLISWTTYRQQLRDLPNMIAEQNVMNMDISWPTVPES